MEIKNQERISTHAVWNLFQDLVLFLWNFIIAMFDLASNGLAHFYFGSLNDMCYLNNEIKLPSSQILHSKIESEVEIQEVSPSPSATFSNDLSPAKLKEETYLISQPTPMENKESLSELMDSEDEISFIEPEIHSTEEQKAKIVNVALSGVILTPSPSVNQQVVEKKKKKTRRGKKKKNNTNQESNDKTKIVSDSTTSPVIQIPEKRKNISNSNKSDDRFKNFRKRERRDSKVENKMEHEITSSAGKHFVQETPRRFSHSVLRLKESEEQTENSFIRPIRQPFGPLLGSKGFSSEYQTTRLARMKSSQPL